MTHALLGERIRPANWMATIKYITSLSNKSFHYSLDYTATLAHVTTVLEKAP